MKLGLVKILSLNLVEMLMFGWGSEVEVNILKLGLVKIFDLDLVEMLICWCVVEILKSMLFKIEILKLYYVQDLWSCDMNSTLGSVVPLAMFNSYFEMFMPRYV